MTAFSSTSNISPPLHQLLWVRSSPLMKLINPFNKALPRSLNEKISACLLVAFSPLSLQKCCESSPYAGCSMQEKEDVIHPSSWGGPTACFVLHAWGSFICIVNLPHPGSLFHDYRRQKMPWFGFTLNNLLLWNRFLKKSNATEGLM